ncbi:MAG: hypothetical protein IJ518_00265 [Clostridia bacterium]|nr:hypothetical protein [Clostridia bacterium]
MTGMSILRQAYSLLGQPERLTAETAGETGLLVINQICSELWHREHAEEFVPLDNLGQRVALSGRCLPALTYGTAMLLCLNSQEETHYDRYLELYRQATAGIGGQPWRRAYTMPTEEVTA